MREYGFSLTRILPSKGRIVDSVFLYGRIRVSENPYSRIFYAVENKIMNKKLTDIQIKFDKRASDNEMLQSKIIVSEKTTGTLQENLNSNNSKITELEISVHKLKQYSRKECVEIA